MTPITHSFSNLTLTDSSLDPQIHVTYQENLTLDELNQQISNIAKPEVLFWYIGAYGMKEDSTKFYKDMIGHVVHKTDGTCHLLDLTAWGAFTNPKAKITSSNRCGDQINEFHPNIRVVKTADIFGKMQYLQNLNTVDYFKNHVVTRPFLNNASEGFKETGLKIGDVFKNNCPIFERIYEQDCAKSYSAVQYVEGSFLVDDIVQKRANDTGDINVVFALPNDEAKYYRDENNSFAIDTSKLIKATVDEKLKGRKINVHFLNFKYGEEMFNRPYNAGRKVVKKLTKDMVV